MSSSQNQEHLKNRIRELEGQLSELKLDLENARFQSDSKNEKLRFYQLIADFTFGWELWFDPNANIKYCSPSCYDLTGFTSNQIINSSGIKELLVYEVDREKYHKFLSGALNQVLVNQTLEFRILTRTKQLRWCIMSVRGVYNEKGKYLGVRASVQDITRLKNAMGHISELEKGKEFEMRTKQRLQSELDLKDRELVSFLLQLSQKNELIVKSANLLKQAKHDDGRDLKPTFQKLEGLLKSSTVQTPDWVLIEKQMEKSHPGFLGRLKTQFPFISEKDQKLCCFVRLGLSSKEISGLLNITPKSVEIARVRLRKKLQLPSKVRLSSFVMQF
uniref:PAS domain-containing protein n=1 Tax=uncultured Draconibacterium sp. TaxID=1573823 RepID=UPI003216FC98